MENLKKLAFIIFCLLSFSCKTKKQIVSSDAISSETKLYPKSSSTVGIIISVSYNVKNRDWELILINEQELNVLIKISAEEAHTIIDNNIIAVETKGGKIVSLLNLNKIIINSLSN